ncbi:MAG: O-antigen ligase family protein [Bacteroidales bacterium]|nr:O-antigen ligase family protein [Bacteroidales bacterium]MCF8457166.1 O-antigen ligase family protein [Bacteroidales bacterium]
MLNQKYLTHFNVYYLGLILLAVSLPLSVFTMSVSQFLLAINWIWEGDFKRKFHIIKERKAVLIFLLIFVVHLLGLIYTSWPDGFLGPKYNALKDLRIKLPMFILPIIIASSAGLTARQLKILLLFFIAAVTVNSFISTGVLLGVGNVPINDIRDISLFISHIRFALLINIAVFSLGYFLFSKNSSLIRIEKFIYSGLLVWLIFFLILLQSLTGLGLLIICSAVFLAVWIFRLKHLPLRLVIFSLLIAIPLVMASYLAITISGFRHFDKYEIENLDKYTAQGNPYLHNINNLQVENGHWVGLYICEKELKEEWDKVSECKYGGPDKKGQGIKYTIMRYLTSLNLRKDAEGVKKLSLEDVKAIEEGYANHILKNKLSLYGRFYESVWEIDLYLRGGNPSSHSIAQRIEYMKAGFRIIGQNPLIGVGTGDAQLEFNKQYELMQTKLAQQYRHRAHNQFVTFAITFGFLGLLIILYGMFAPIYYEGRGKDYFFLMFMIIAFVSMLNEDTLETQPGVSFFSFFYCLFLFGRKAD